MLSREDYNDLKKISDDIDKYYSFSKNDLDKALDAGDRLASLFYSGFDLYLDERERIFTGWNEKSYQDNRKVIFFDKECDFDKWFDVVHSHYYPALINIKQSDLSKLDQNILMLLGIFTRFCERLVPYMDICVSYCLELPELFPDKKRELSNIGKVMSAAFYLEKLGRIIEIILSDQSASNNSYTLTFQRCVELRKKC